MEEQPQDATQLIEANIPLWKIVLAPVAKMVRPIDDNRSINDEELNALMESIKQNTKYLMLNPIIVNLNPERYWYVISGDKRRMAAEKLGMDKVPTAFVNVSKQEEKKINILFNKHNGEWVPQLLNADLHDLQLDGVDMSGIGFTPMDLVNVMSGSATATVNPENDPANKGTTPKQNKCKHDVESLVEDLKTIVSHHLSSGVTDITELHHNITETVKGHLAPQPQKVSSEN